MELQHAADPSQLLQDHPTAQLPPEALHAAGTELLGPGAAVALGAVPEDMQHQEDAAAAAAAGALAAATKRGAGAAGT